MKDLSQLQNDFDEFEVEWPMLVDELAELMMTTGALGAAQSLETLDGVDQVETFYLSVLDGRARVEVSPDRLDRMILAFLGDFLIQKAGGHWALELDGGPFHGCPQVVGWKDHDGLSFEPVGLREKVRTTRTPGTFRDHLSWLMNKREKEADIRRELNAIKANFQKSKRK